MPLLSVVTSAYNEEDGITGFLEELDKIRIPGADIEFIVVDNGSTDETGALLDKFSRRRFRVFHNPGPTRGMGQGYIRGFKEARGGVIAIIRSDWQEDPHDIPRLYKIMNDRSLDCVIGWRKDRQDPLLRLFTSWVYNTVANILFGLNQPDLNGAPKIFRAEYVKRMPLENEQSFIDIELLHRIRKAGGSMASVPAKHFPRRKGRTTVDLGYAYTMFADLFRYRLRL